MMICVPSATSLGEDAKFFNLLMGIGALGLVATPVFLILFIICFISEKRKSGAKEKDERQINKEKALTEIELERHKAMLDITREHNEKSEFRICGYCGARTSAASGNCTACGAGGGKK